MTDTSQIPDLWPSDIKPPLEPTPVQLLKQQASLLAKKTAGIVTASVDFARADLAAAASRTWESIAYFVLSNQALDYTYLLFSMHFDVGETYPVHIVWQQKNTKYRPG